MRHVAVGPQLGLGPGAQTRIDRATFRENEAGSGGGVAFQSSSGAWLSNSIFEQNTATQGGAIATFDSAAIVSNITGVRNCGTRGTLPGHGMFITGTVGSTLVNSILWDRTPCGANASEQMIGFDVAATVTYPGQASVVAVQSAQVIGIVAKPPIHRPPRAPRRIRML